MALPRLLNSSFRSQPQGSAADFNRWLETPAGQALLQSEHTLLKEILPRMVGYTALQCVVGKPYPLLDGCYLRQQVYMGAEAHPGIGVQARPCTFPIRKHSLDLLVLHHTLDFDDDPHQMLRNAARTLVPGGTVVVIGFNPSSLWGLMRLFGAGARGMPWQARFLSAQRVGDWLSVLGCVPEGLESRFHSPPRSRIGRWLAWLGDQIWSRHGSFYIMVARRRAATMRPARPRFVFPERAPNVVPVSLSQWRQKPGETLE